MALPKKSIIYETLNKTQHWTDEDAQRSLFPDLFQDASLIHAEYWLYSDLHNLFGEKFMPAQNPHPSISMPQLPITKRGNPKFTTPTTDFYDGHIVTTKQKYNIDGAYYPDLRISRYGCWQLTKDNPALIFARTYFISPSISPDMTYSTIADTSYQFARVHLRQELSDMEKILAGILNKHHANFSLFNHHMTRAFYYNYGAKDIKATYNIPQSTNDPLANYMGAASLHARITALQNTINRYNSLITQNIDTFYNILYQELIQSRVNMLKHTGTAPEQDIFPTHIKKIERQLRDTERNFTNQFAAIKLK